MAIISKTIRGADVEIGALQDFKSFTLSEKIGHLVAGDGQKIEIFRNVTGFAFELRMPSGFEIRVNLAPLIQDCAQELFAQDAAAIGARLVEAVR